MLDGDVPVPHRGDGARRLRRLRQSRRRGRAAYRRRLAAGGVRPDRRRDPHTCSPPRAAAFLRSAPCSRSISPRAASRACASASTAPTGSRAAQLVAAAAGVDRLRAGQRHRAAGAGVSGRARAAGLPRPPSYAPWIEPLQAHYNFARFGVGGVRAGHRADHPAHVAAGRAAAARRHLARHRRDAGAVARRAASPSAAISPISPTPT